ncbi:hypothetical protein DVH24_005306 [Malus domestica]|uniref:Uncharacterized protein n=1 Tax=Malus domestica TaxID=3750 RepID=A0A498KR27_MALDO|nr:hypothetical protein DVH24_005306 [Malus domestica]
MCSLRLSFTKPLIIQNAELQYQVNEYFQFANIAPSFLLLLIPKLCTLSLLQNTPHAPLPSCRCTSSSSSFSSLFVGLSATRPSPSRYQSDQIEEWRCDSTAATASEKTTRTATMEKGKGVIGEGQRWAIDLTDNSTSPSSRDFPDPPGFSRASL